MALCSMMKNPKIQQTSVVSSDTHYTWASRFEDLNLSPELIKPLYVEMKFEKLSIIQAKGLPMIMTPPHKHLIPTLIKEPPQAPCICPTSELANQVMMNVLSTRGVLEQGDCLDALISIPLDSSGGNSSFSL